MQNFAQPAAGEQQKPECRSGELVDLGSAIVSLGQVLGSWTLLVRIPRHAGGFRLTDRRAKSLQFMFREEPLAPMLWELTYPTRRILALGYCADLRPERVHAADHSQHSVCLKW